MIDFHSHVLPEMDDGAADVQISLEILRESRRQGVRLICATPHFYADEEDPSAFLTRRKEAYRHLRTAMGDAADFPEVLLGAEVLYFPGISGAEAVRGLALEGTPLLLIEPPMMRWSDSMLDEIALCRQTLGCLPVIAHIDRYMRFLNDDTLLRRAAERRLLIQINAAWFLRPQSAQTAVESLFGRQIHFLGSDCHNMTDRGPNMADAEDVIRRAGLGNAFARYNERLYQLLRQKCQ